MAGEGDLKIRRIAIVLQSMDADTIRTLLSQFPIDVARAIRKALANLGPVSPAERSAAVEEVQNLLGKTNLLQGRDSIETQSPAAQVLDRGAPIQDSIQWSSEAQRSVDDATGGIGTPAGSRALPESMTRNESGPNWLQIPPQWLAHILQEERAIVVAAVLQELPVAVATSVLQQLPIPLAAATMATFPNLHRNDPNLLAELLDQVRARVDASMESEFKTQAGLEKLKAIGALVPEDHRSMWACALGNVDPQLPMILGWDRTAWRDEALANFASNGPLGSSQNPPVAPLPQRPSATTATPPIASPSIPSPSIALPSIASPPEVGNPTGVSQSPPRYGSLIDLLALTDADFVSVLYAVEPETVLLALCNAPRRFVRRVERLLPKREVPRLRQRVRQLNDVSLREIDNASAELVAQAQARHALGKLGSPGRASLTPAA